jgi:hypothetical protein
MFFLPYSYHASTIPSSSFPTSVTVTSTTTTHSSSSLREVESPLALPYSHAKLLAQNLNSAVIRHLQVIDARHDRRQVVIGCEGWFAGLANNRKHWRESLEACGSISMMNIRHGISRE